MARKQSPDILSDLLGGKAEEAIPEGQSTVMPVSQQDSKPVRHKAGKADQDKTKATFYIAQETVDHLEEGWLQLRKLARPEVRTRISKSDIVEKALDLLLQDLEEKGPDSQLARIMASQ